MKEENELKRLMKLPLSNGKQISSDILSQAIGAAGLIGNCIKIGLFHANVIIFTTSIRRHIRLTKFKPTFNYNNAINQTKN